MQRFIYHASGMAIGGRIRRPVDCYLEPMASCVLPSTGGKASAKAGPFSLTDPSSGELILSFDSAETTIEAAEASPGVHATLFVSTVRNLNVQNVLRAEEITARLSLVYDAAGDKVTIDPSGSGYTGLTINGQALEVTVDSAMAREAASYQAFRQKYPEIPETKGWTRFSLARNPQIRFDPYDYGYLPQPNFGRIYFCEWSAAPYSQCLTMLRFKLGSPVDGDVEAGSGGGNGQSYP